MFPLFKKSKKTCSDTKPLVYQLGDLTLPIVRSARRKSIAVKQKNFDMVIEVPKQASAARIQQVLEQNHAWLLAQLDKLKVINESSFNGLHGESFDLYGQSYHCVWQDRPVSQSRKLSDAQICHHTQSLIMSFKPELDETRKQQLSKKALLEFFKQQAKNDLTNKTDKFAEQMELDYQSITIKGYKSRWGSCYPDGRIQFNWRLLQAPEWVVDYVVVHELAHLVHANHSRAFWNLVVDYYPETPAAKKVLKQHGQRWINLLQK